MTLATDDELVLREIDLGLASLCLLVDEAALRHGSDIFAVIDELTRAVVLNSNHRQAAGFCAFVVLRHQGYL
jgi:hypothetical protein